MLAGGVHQRFRKRGLACDAAVLSRGEVLVLRNRFDRLTPGIDAKAVTRARCVGLDVVPYGFATRPAGIWVPVPDHVAAVWHEGMRRWSLPETAVYRRYPPCPGRAGLRYGDRILIRNCGACGSTYADVGFNGFPPLDVVAI